MSLTLHTRIGHAWRALAVAALGAVIALGASPAPARAAEAMSQERIDQANDAYNNVDTTLEFVTMSDTELSGKTEDDAYNAALPWYQEIAKWAKQKNFTIQAVMDNGDVVGGNEGDNTDARVGAWYRAVDRVFSQTFPNSKILFSQGNHDYADWMGKVFDVNHKKNGRYDGKWYYPHSEDDYVGNYHVKIGGYDFIALDYNGKQVFGYAGQRTGYQDFLKKTLADIKSAKDYDPAKPIFIQIHSGYTGTTLGGPFHANYDLAGPDLKTILKDYPQAFVASAHTHFLVAPETSIYQKDFTFFENGSMNYPYQDVPSDFLEGNYLIGNSGDPQNGRDVERTCNFFSILKDGTVVIRRFDVSRRRWIGMPWTVKPAAGKAGFKYTDAKRSKVAPWWEDGAKVSTSKLGESTATLDFTQAVDDELVHYYKVELTDDAGKPVSFQARQVPDFKGDTKPKAVQGSFRTFSRFFYVSPDQMSFELSGLKPSTTYHVKVTAYDSFDNASTTPLEGSFRTSRMANFPSYPAGTLPEGLAKGQFMDMTFEGNLTDAKDTDAKVTAHGTTSFVAGRSTSAGKALRIGGTNNDYIDLGKRDQWNLGTDKNLTASFWINVTSESGYAAILSNKNWSHYYEKGINIAPESSNTRKLEFTVGDGSNGVYATGKGLPNYNGGGWHMMTVSVDRTTQKASTYFDGVRVAQSDISKVGDMTSGLNMLLGTDGGKTYGTIGFDIDDLSMWSRALSDQEVQALYAATDSGAATKALDDAVTYAADLANEVKQLEQGGQVFDAAAVSELDAAIKAAANAKDTKAAYDRIKAAVNAIEHRTVRWTVKATGKNGTVEATEGVTDGAAADGSSVSFKLTPNAGYTADGLTVDGVAADGWSVKGDVLTVKKVTGPVAITVTFAKKTAQQPGGNGGTQQPGGNQNNGGDNQQPGGDKGNDNGGQGDKGNGNGSGQNSGNGSDKTPGTSSKTPAGKGTAKKGALPKTGDDTFAIIGAIVIAGAVLVAAGVLYQKRHQA